MTDTSALSTCPFCGERAETYFIPERHSYQIECSDVFGCTARVTQDSERAAIEAWNLRSPSSASQSVAALTAPAREPLTDGQIDEIHLANSDAYERGDVEYESHGFARAIEHHHGIKATNQESNK